MKSAKRRHSRYVLEIGWKQGEHKLISLKSLLTLYDERDEKHYARASWSINHDCKKRFHILCRLSLIQPEQNLHRNTLSTPSEANIR